MKRTLGILTVTILLISSSTFLTTELVLASPVVADPHYTLEVFASGLNGPFSMAFDGDGNLYVSNEGVAPDHYPGTTISKIGPDGQVSVFATGFEGPAGLAFDDEGNLWVSDDGSMRFVDGCYVTGNIWKITSDGGTAACYSVEGNPNALGFDTSWNLLVVTHAGGVYKINHDDGSTSFFAGPFESPQAVAFDKLGNIYVAEGSSDQLKVYKFDSSGSLIDVLSAEVFGGGSNQGGLAFDCEGNLYVCMSWNVYVFTPEGILESFIEGFDLPRGLVFDETGRLYITEFYAGIIWKATPHFNKVEFENSHGYFYSTDQDTIANVPMPREEIWLFQISNSQDETGLSVIKPAITVLTDLPFTSFSSPDPTISPGKYEWNFSMELPETLSLPTNAREEDYVDYHRPGFSVERRVTPETLSEPITIQELSLTFTLEDPLPTDANSFGIWIGWYGVVFMEKQLVNFTILSLNNVEGWHTSRELYYAGWSINPGEIVIGKTYDFRATVEAVKSSDLEGSPTAKPGIQISYAHWENLGIVGTGSSGVAANPEGTVMVASAEGEYEWHGDVSYARQDFWINQVISEIIPNPDPPPAYTVRIPASVDVKPDSYNLGRKADCVTAYIELPEGYEAEDINVSTVLLNGIFPALSKPTGIGDYDRDGIPDLMVKFNVTAPQADVGATLKDFGRFVNITVFVSGSLKDGTLFIGNDTIKLIILSPKLAALLEAWEMFS